MVHRYRQYRKHTCLSRMEKYPPPLPPPHTHPYPQKKDGVLTAWCLQVREAAKELGYQPDETFCLKISQLREIFEVRWSVFLLGPAGCGKTAIWRTLMHAQQNFGEKTIYKPINPKVLSPQPHHTFLTQIVKKCKRTLQSAP